MTARPPYRRGAASLALAALAVVVALLSAPAGAAGPYAVPGTRAEPGLHHRVIGGDPFVPGEVYRGDFPDPSVLRAGRHLYAYSTGTAGLNLPILVSTRGKTWRANGLTPGYDVPDGLPRVASWADGHAVGNRWVAPTWAPSVMRIGGRFVLAYAVRVRHHGLKMCLSTAVADRPIGPFVDRSRKPLVCPRRMGAIDPQLYRERHHVWLLYKTEDNTRHRPTRLWIRRLDAAGTGFARHGQKHRLLKGHPDWESGLVEGPAMIRFRGHRYLFYSGGPGFASPGYATGYALCPGLFRCTRVTDRNAGPLLASGDGLVGPGGGTPFVNRAGHLRLAYHAWRQGQVGYAQNRACTQKRQGCPQRRMYVARLHADREGLLTVADSGAGALDSLGG